MKSEVVSCQFKLVHKAIVQYIMTWLRVLGISCSYHLKAHLYHCYHSQPYPRSCGEPIKIAAAPNGSGQSRSQCISFCTFEVHDGSMMDRCGSKWPGFPTGQGMIHKQKCMSNTRNRHWSVCGKLRNARVLPRYDHVLVVVSTVSVINMS